MLLAYDNNPIDKEQWLKKLYFEVLVRISVSGSKEVFLENVFLLCTSVCLYAALGSNYSRFPPYSQTIYQLGHFRCTQTPELRGQGGQRCHGPNIGRRETRPQADPRLALRAFCFDLNISNRYIYKTYTVLPFLHDGKIEKDFVCSWYRILESGV